MAVTIKDVEYVAALARLSFTAEEKEVLTGQLNEILVYMEQLNGLDTEGVEPLSQVIDLDNALRPDEMRPSYPQAEILKNAPAHDDQFFKVPKVLGDR